MPDGRFTPFGTPLRGHEDRVVEIAFSPDGRTLASASEDGTIRLWDPYAGTESAVLRGHTSRVFSVAFHPAEPLLASSSRAADASIRLWNTQTGEELETLWSGNDSVWSVAFSPDGTRLAAGAQSEGALLWDLATRSPLALPGRHGVINVVAFGPDGTLAAAGKHAVVYRWGANLSALPDVEGSGLEIRGLAYAPDGSFAFGDLSGRIEIHRPATEPLMIEAGALRGGVWSVAFSPEGSQLAISHEAGSVQIWDAYTSRHLDTLLAREDDKATWVAFSPQGDLLAASCNDGTIHLWHRDSSPMTLDGRPPKAAVRAHSAAVTSLAFTGDGSLLLSGGGDGMVRAWTTSDLRRVGQAVSIEQSGPGPTAVSAVVMSDDGSTRAALWDDGSVLWWLSGQVSPKPPPVDEPATALALSADGSLLALALPNAIVPVTLSPEIAQQGPYYYTRRVRALLLSPDSSLLMACDDTGLLLVIDAETRGVIHNPQVGNVNAAVLSPDGTRLFLCDVQGGVVSWHLGADGRHLPSPERLQPSTGDPIVAAALDDRGGRLAVAHAARGLRFVPVTSSRGTPPSWTIEVRAVAFSPDGRLLAIGTETGEIELWEASALAFLEAPPSSSEPERRVEVVVTMDADIASRVDRLGVRREARGLARVLTARDTGTPFAVALLGDWGSGKSTFMQLLDAEISEISEDAAKLVLQRRDLDASPFCAGIRTVEFNAWHYADDHLWAGLIRHILDKLSGHPTVDAAEQEITDSERTSLVAKIATARLDLAAVESDLLASESPPRVLRFFRWLVDSPETFSGADQAVRGVRQRLRRLGWIAAVAVVLGLGGAAALWATDSVSAWVTAGLTVVGAVGAGLGAVHRVLVTSLNGWRTKLREIADAAIGGAPLPGHEAQVARRTALATQISELEADLAATDPERRLTRFLHDRRDSGDYAAYRGLLSLVHDDLAQMTDLIDKHVKAWSTRSDASAPPLQRVILYIDDLDRCEPKRVVEVLAAIHLILAMQLFVVVVAVDPRWLLRCLRHHYVELLDTADDDRKLGVHASTPISYLEKIFQVAYQIPPMHTGLSTLVETLMPLRPPDDEEDDEDLRAGAVPDPQDTPGETPSPREQLQQFVDERLREEREGEQAERSLQRFIEERRQTEQAEIQSVDSRPLDFSAEEIAMVVALGPILGTPRTLKRLVNVYRVIRATIADTDEQRLADEYGYVLLLLAVALGQPIGAPWLFTLVSTSDDDDLPTALDAAKPLPSSAPVDTLPAPTTEVLTQLREDITKVIAESKTPLTHLPTYRTWLPTITRYTFRHRPT